MPMQSIEHDDPWSQAKFAKYAVLQAHGKRQDRDGRAKAGTLRPSLRKLLDSVGRRHFRRVWSSMPQLQEAKLREVL